LLIGGAVYDALEVERGFSASGLTPAVKGGLAAFEVLAAGFGSGFGPDFVSAAFASAGLVAVA
jgi:hypothetical protein